jgi:hypothetical protein
MEVVPPMKNSEIHNLAIALLQADSQDVVIDILVAHGLWDAPECWRLYGDRDGNFATIGNQQSRPDAALVEKIVNCVDARLLNECLTRKLDPQSADAPQSIIDAVLTFFGKPDIEGTSGGYLQGWSQPRQLKQSQYITVAVTGPTAREGSPSITIADLGEGQTPARMPETFLSIDRDNKLRIPFVQGKFNMGGTGALKFCGRESLQLIISRRNPAILKKAERGDTTSDQWGLTVVRRERPSGSTGGVRNSVFRYLAPVGAKKNPKQGEVLAFTATSLPLMPENNKPYSRTVEYGSAIKLYEYDMKGYRSHALMKDGLLFRLELLLPGIALPVRIHECRRYQGVPERSFANTLVGLTARLDENRGQNLEQGYPTSVPFSVRGQEMVARIYAFKEGKAESYRTNEGVIFTINGQTHGSLPKTLFARQSVRMSRLASSLLVVVDCSKLSVDSREDLFMNSRDRLSNGELRKALEEELEDLISRHPGLRELREKRRNEEVAERLKESKPLEDVLSSILKSSPSLSRLFQLGQRLSRPHRGDTSNQNGNEDDSSTSKPGSFRGRHHPTFFRFHKVKAGQPLERTAQLGRRCRMKFETDVENEYFSRPVLPGHYHIEILEGPLTGPEIDHNLVLHDGVANWSLSLPAERLSLGDEVVVQCTVTDETLQEPFVNIATLRLEAVTKPGTGAGIRDRKSDSEGKQSGSGSVKPNANGDKAVNLGIQMPTIIRVRSDDENWRRHKFDEFTACKVLEDAGGDADDEDSVFTFYVNADNRFLRTDMKLGEEDVALTEAKFVYGNVLIGLALIHESRRGNGHGGHRSIDGEETEVSIEDVVENTTRALSPFLVPMIDNHGALSPDQAGELAAIGDDE